MNYINILIISAAVAAATSTYFLEKQLPLIKEVVHQADQRQLVLAQTMASTKQVFTTDTVKVPKTIDEAVASGYLWAPEGAKKPTVLIENLKNSVNDYNEHLAESIKEAEENYDTNQSSVNDNTSVVVESPEVKKVNRLEALFNADWETYNNE